MKKFNAAKKSLDLGCGLQPKNPYNAESVFGIDVRGDAPKNIISADLAVENIPFSDQYFDFVTAFDFFEHVPRTLYMPKRRNAFVELMNEIHRVLKPSGLLMSSTPSFPDARVFRDPTHVNFITDETFPLYFGDARQTEQYCWASMYGFRGAFQIKTQIWRGGSLLTIMKKVEPLKSTDSTSALALNNNKINIALDLENQGDLSAARTVLWEVHLADPSQSRPLYLLSRLALAQNDFNESLRISEFGILVDPNFAALYLIKGDSLKALGSHQEALESYDKALEIYPDFIEALTKKGSVLDFLGFKEKAQKIHEEILNLSAIDEVNATL